MRAREAGPSGRIAATVALAACLAAAAWLAADAAAAARHSKPRFKPARVYPVGFNPLSFAAGDLDQDGRLDLLTANFAAAGDPAAKISVTGLQGKHRGRFKTIGTFPVPSQPAGIALGKLAGDGDPDIVIAGFSSPGEVTVFKGGPGLSFGGPESYGIGGSPRQIVIKDFTGDRIADIAVRRQEANDIAVMPGNPNGTFGLPTLLPAPTPGFLTDLISARINKDKLPDLVASTTDGKVAVFLGQPGGSFAAPLLSAAGPFPLGLAAANFNGDHRRDLAVTNQLGDFIRGTGAGGAPSKGDFVAILRGRGDGTFRRPRARAVGRGGGVPEDLVATDLNRDHRPDVALTLWRRGKVAILRGRKRGRLTAPMYVDAGDWPWGLLAARLDGNRKPDLAVALNPPDAPGSVAVLLQKKRKRRR